MKYVSNVSICEQYIVMTYQNGMNFLGHSYGPNYVSMLACIIFGVNLDIVSITFLNYHRKFYKLS